MTGKRIKGERKKKRRLSLHVELLALAARGEKASNAEKIVLHRLLEEADRNSENRVVLLRVVRDLTAELEARDL